MRVSIMYPRKDTIKYPSKHAITGQPAKLTKANNTKQTEYSFRHLGYLFALALFTMSLILGLLPTQSASAVSPDAAPACFGYTTTDGEVTIIDYYGNEGNDAANPACPRDVGIPGTLGGNPVGVIGNSALGYNELTSVTIPNSVTIISDSAFSGNHLTSVTIPNSVISIGDSAFSDNQLTSLTIPSSVTTIGFFAFQSNQLALVTVNGNNITWAGPNMFDYNPITSFSYNGITYTDSDPIDEICYKFNVGTKAILGLNYADITTIQNNQQACLNKNIIIPSTIGGTAVTTIDDNAFGSSQLTSVVIPNSVTTIDYNAFSNNQLTSVTIPNSVTTLGNHAFHGNKLSSVTISDSVATLEYGVFSNNQLTSITIPDSVTTIDVNAFYDNQLTSVIIPDSVNTIGEDAFHDNKLVTVAIPNSVNAIGSGAFKGNQLTSVTIGNSVAVIGGSAFYDNQITTVTIPDSVTTIGNYAFQSNQLTSVIINGDNITSAGSQIFNFNPIVSLKYNGINYVNSESAGETCYKFDTGSNAITGFNFADITTIQSNQQACLNMNITIPSTIGGTAVTAIDSWAFYTNQLTSVIIPNSVTAIGDYAFYGNQLISVTVPNSIVSLGNSVFSSNPMTSDGNGGSLANQLATTKLGSSQVATVTTPAGTILTCISADAASSLASSDSGYSYPLGLVNFCFTASQSSNEVSLTFETDLKSSQVTPRKYSSTTHQYSDLPASASPTITETTSNGHHALKLTYAITDNGELDTNLAIGQIDDPVGLAVKDSPSQDPSQSTKNILANTGKGTVFIIIGAISLMLASAGMSLAVLRERKALRLF